MASKLRIVFVDDEPHILRGIRRAMGERDDVWEMDFCHSGAEALELMRRQPFDVVVSDMRMPEMDGAQLLNIVRQQHPATVRIILSGYADTEAVLRTVGPAHIYLAKPCDTTVLRAAIERQIPLRRLLDDPDLRALLAGLTNLPSLPEPFLRLQKELRSPTVSPKSIAEIIAQDLAMTAEVLKLTNSAYFALASTVTSPVQAVRLLGVETIQALVLRVGIFRQFAGNAALVRLLQALSHNSLAIGRLAENIAVTEGADMATAKASYCAAMLADVGCIVLMDGRSVQYRRMLSRICPELPLAAAEREEFGADHGLIGAYLLGLWGFNDTIVEAIAYSCTPDDCPTRENIILRTLHAARTLGPPSPLMPAKCPDGCMGGLDYLLATYGKDRVERWRTLAMKQTAGAA